MPSYCSGEFVPVGTSRSSRSGPTTPSVPAAARVWQVPQLFWNSSFASWSDSETLDQALVALLAEGEVGDGDEADRREDAEDDEGALAHSIEPDARGPLAGAPILPVVRETTLRK